MEFLSQNKVNTTTMVAIASGTATVQSLFDRNVPLAYSTIGYTGATSTSITISFTAATVLSHVLLQNHNLKDFSLHYNGTTTNSLFSTTSNSLTSTYVSFSSVTVSSITLVMADVITAGRERKVGELVLAERKLVFERNPTIRDFSPVTYRTQVIHQMPDGGTTVFHLRDKYRARLSWRYVTQSFRDSLFLLYRSAAPLYFLPKPTSTAWDGVAAETNWIGDFDFQFSSNVEESGFSGSMNLQQTPSA